jgi:hypothetical protein
MAVIHGVGYQIIVPGDPAEFKRRLAEMQGRRDSLCGKRVLTIEESKELTRLQRLIPQWEENDDE